MTPDVYITNCLIDPEVTVDGAGMPGLLLGYIGKSCVIEVEIL